ncbi:MAG: Gldg family protein [Odoribacteraceae bacterium]|jgi:ABC-2 type transport system permease protein|nr:Gldg family protein [Odoribacteraceae bacterium]
MKAIFRIARVELQTLFYSPVAWLILIVFAFQASMAFTSVFGDIVRDQDMGYRPWSVTSRAFAGWRGLFVAMQNYLYMYIPLLTMGLVSREYSSGSIKLLYSSPLTNPAIILGKYIAAIAYCLVLTGILALFVLFGGCLIDRVDIPLALSGLLGTYLLVCTYAAIGLFMSSITSYQVVAAMGTFATLAILNMVDTLWQEVDFVRDITYWLSIKGRASEIMNGLLCSEDILYFFIVSLLFIFLSVIRLQAKRQGERVATTLARYAAVIVVTALLGYASSRPRLMVFHDATRTNVNTLTPPSQAIIAGIKGPVTITTYVNALDANYWIALPNQIKNDLARFKQYWRFKPDIHFKYVYYYDDAGYLDLDRRFPGLTDRQRMIRVAQSYRLDSTFFKTPEEIRRVIDLAPEGKRFVRLLEHDGKRSFLRVFDDMSVQPTESQISAAFKHLVATLPRVALVTGHGERDARRVGDRDYNRFTIDKPFRYSLVNNGFDFTTLSLDEEVPADVHILVIADPRRPFSPRERQHLDNYIARGDNLLVTGEPARRDIINPVIAPFGVRLLPGSIVKPTENFPGDFILARATKEGIALSPHLENLDVIDASVAMPGCAALAWDDAGFSVTPLLASDTTGSWNELHTTNFVDDTARLSPADGEIERSHVTAVALERQLRDRQQKIIIIGDADCISNGEINIGRKDVRASNYLLVSASFFWLSDHEVPIDIRRPAPPDRKIHLGMDGARAWKFAWIGGLPAVLLFLFLFTWIRRRGR